MEKYRKKLDVIDDSMRQLFIERMDLVKKIAQYKKKNNILVEDRQRENEMIERLVVEDPKLKDLYGRFISEILSLSKAYQELLMKESS